MGVQAGVLLCWLHVLCALVFGDVWKVEVESKMDALVSSCVVLPCTFKYPAQEQPSSRIKEKASKPELLAKTSVEEGQPAIFKCSVRHTCPSHQPTLSWNHTGKTLMSYKDIGHGKWEVESILTFTPTKEDDHSSVTCTVKYHGTVEGEMQATHQIFVKEQANLSHFIIPTISGLGAALLVGLLCLIIVIKYKKRIADLQSRNDNTSDGPQLDSRSGLFQNAQIVSPSLPERGHDRDDNQNQTDVLFLAESLRHTGSTLYWKVVGSSS